MILVKQWLLLAIVCGVGFLAFVGDARAEKLVSTPINLSLFSPVELIPVKPRRVVGLILNLIYGHEDELWGLQAVSLLESDGLSECFHYDAPSQIVIEQRSARAMLELLNAAAVP